MDKQSLLSSYDNLPEFLTQNVNTTTTVQEDESDQYVCVQDGTCRMNTCSSDGCSSDTCSSDGCSSDSSQTYIISATVYFDANGGSVSVSSLSNSKESSEQSGTVSITFPRPTWDAYHTFQYWELPGSPPSHWTAGTHQIYAQVGGYDWYATAIWERNPVSVSISLIEATDTTLTVKIGNPSSVPNDSYYYYWQIYEGVTHLSDKDQSTTNKTANITFSGLNADTIYYIKCGAYTSDWSENTAYGEDGFNTKPTGITPWIYATKNGITKWWPATVYIYKNSSEGWVQAQPYIYDNGEWN